MRSRKNLQQSCRLIKTWSMNFGGQRKMLGMSSQMLLGTCFGLLASAAASADVQCSPPQHDCTPANGRFFSGADGEDACGIDVATCSKAPRDFVALPTLAGFLGFAAVFTLAWTALYATVFASKWVRRRRRVLVTSDRSGFSCRANASKRNVKLLAR